MPTFLEKIDQFALEWLAMRSSSAGQWMEAKDGEQKLRQLAQQLGYSLVNESLEDQLYDMDRE